MNGMRHNIKWGGNSYKLVEMDSPMLAVIENISPCCGVPHPIFQNFHTKHEFPLN
jgi:hypothetical protein